MDAPQTDSLAAAGAELALPYLEGTEEFAAFAARARDGIARARVSPPILPLVVAALWRSREGATPRGLAIVVEDDDAARSLIDEASTFLPGAPAAYLPSRGALYGSGIDPAPHLVGERHRALDALAAGGLVAVSADALLERVPGPATRPRPVTLELGSDPGLETVVEQLAAAGYTRVDTVEERGEVSVRGGLVDVFPTTGREPLRIEFFGDEVERLSAFSVFTQRSIRDLDEAIVYPAGEPEDVEHAWGADEDEAPPMPGGLVSLLPELTGAASVLAWNPEQVADAVREGSVELAEQIRDAARRGGGYLRPDDVEQLLEGAGALEEMPLGQPYSFEAQPPALAAFGIAEAENELRALTRAGYRVLVCFPHLGEAERTRLALNRVEAELVRPGEAGPQQPGIGFAVGALRHGLVAPALQLAVLPGGHLFRRRSARRAPGLGRALAAFGDLRPGDFVVHEDHGVGRFLQFDTKEVGGVVRDYLHLEFRGDDRLYVPHEQLGKVSRYIGSDGSAPALSKLGGKSWLNLRTRARTAVRELAGELLALYARRQNEVRPPFPQDDEWAAQLEATFPYEETNDQLRVDRRGDRGHGERPADGPAGMRRRRFRQDRGRREGDAEGGHRRAPSAGAGADNGARPAARGDLQGAFPRSPDRRRDGLPVPAAVRGQDGAGRLPGRHRRRPRRHAPRALA